MARNDTFTLNVSHFVAKARGRTDLVVRKVSLDLFRRVIRRSPVRTGRFKGNWQLGLNALPTASLVAFDKTKGAAGAAGERVASGLAMARAGDVIYLANNVAYARRLEYGWSRQAPYGMIRPSVMEYRAIVQRAAQEAQTEVP